MPWTMSSVGFQLKRRNSSLGATAARSCEVVTTSVALKTSGSTATHAATPWTCDEV